MIFVSILATVLLMTFFSDIYYRGEVKNVETSQFSKDRRHFHLFDYFSFHMLYVLNILTNQGRILFRSNYDNLAINSNFWLKGVENGAAVTHFELWLDFGYWSAGSWSILTRVSSSRLLQFRKWNQPSNPLKIWLKVKTLESFFDLILLLDNKY